MAAPTASRFLNRQVEKTTSPEQEAGGEQKNTAGLVKLQVLDLTDLDEELAALDEEEESFADELEEIEARTATATVGLPRFKPDNDGRMMERVSHKYICALMKSPPPSAPLGDCSIEAIRRSTGITDEEELETVVRGYRALQSAEDTMNDIIRQFRAQGYAYVTLPDDDESLLHQGKSKM